MLRDLLGEHGTDDLLAEINNLYQQLKILGWKELRPWDEFFAVFKTPQLTLTHLEQRITTNFLQYRSNYVCVCGLIICLQVLRAPVIILTLVLIASLYSYALIVKKESIYVGEIELNNTAKKAICAIVTIFLLVITRTLEHIIWTVVYCGLLNGLHMIFRPRNVVSKVNKMYEEAKMNGYDVFSSNGGESKSNRYSGGDNSDRYKYKKSENYVSTVDPEDPPYESSSKQANAAYFPLSRAAAASTSSTTSSRTGYDESKSQSPSNAARMRTNSGGLPQNVFNMSTGVGGASDKSSAVYRLSTSDKQGQGGSSKKD